MRGPRSKGHPGMGGIDFTRSPFLVIWETTQACDLACRHCRASAIPERDPNELSTAEARRLMDDIRRFGPIIFVLSGGDVLKRPDAVELVEYGAGIGLRMAITPATTPLATPERLRRFKDAGLARLAVSLDGATAASHDRFRRVDGSFDWALRILRDSAEIGLSTQVNTVVARHNVDEFGPLCALMGTLGIVFWEVFFLVPMGRARPEDVASADEFERVFHTMYDLARTAPFDIKATAAPHYHRVVLERRKAERRAAGPDLGTAPGPRPAPARDGIGRAPAVNDGHGFVFISRTGEIFPSGFLPVSAGNVRSHDLVEVYRESPLFRELRDRTLLKGKCGVCEYRDLCGGSRARAFAMTGDYLESEPFCAHVPARHRAAALSP